MNVALPCFRIMRWMLRLKNSFGAPFLILVTIVYWTQGFRSLPWIAISYQLKDELDLSPSASQFLTSVAFMPWSIKPLYGILSDCVPIRGSRRISYLIISSAFSFTPWLLLGLVRAMRMSSLYLTGLLTVQNLGAAMADVVIDAMIAEAARKERAEYSGDLQSMSWLAMALGGMCGSVAGGFALSTFHVNGIFLLFSLFPLLQLVACSLVNEKALSDGAMEYESKGCKRDEKEKNQEPIQTLKRIIGIDRNDTNENELQGFSEKDRDQGVAVCEKLFAQEFDEEAVSAYKGIASMEAEDENLFTEKRNSVLKEDVSEDDNSNSMKRSKELEVYSLNGSKHFEGFSLLNDAGLRRRKNEVDISVSKKDSKRESIRNQLEVSFLSKMRTTFGVLFQALREPAIQRPMVWFFLAHISIPSLSTIMFYYQTNHLHLDAAFLGTSRLVGWGALLLGTFLYSQYFKHVRLRNIFWWTHIGLACITLADIILVTGLNIWLGIPNKAFVVGASALGDAINQFKLMPFLILSGRLCRPGIEGTLFALFMSLNNFGITVSSFFGAGLASALHISSDKFDNFGIGIFIQALCTIIPIQFLFLIPIEATGVSTD